MDKYVMAKTSCGLLGTGCSPFTLLALTLTPSPGPLSVLLCRGEHRQERRDRPY